MRRLLRWLMADPIDPELPIESSERFFIIQDAKLDATGDGRMWLGVMAVTVPFVVVFITGAISLGTRPVLGGMVMAVSFVAVIAAAAMISRRTHAPFVWRVLRRKGYDVCVRCGYWLRGLDDAVARCPECGAAREPLRSKGD